MKGRLLTSVDPPSLSGLGALIEEFEWYHYRIKRQQYCKCCNKLGAGDAVGVLGLDIRSSVVRLLSNNSVDCNAKI